MSIAVIAELLEQVGISASGYTDAELDDALADGVTQPEKH